MKLNNPVRKMEAFLARDPTLKDTAQRAFVSYAKSVFLMKDKSVFDVQSLDTDSFAKSLGLAIPPRIRFLQRLNARTGKASKQQPQNKTYFIDEVETNSNSHNNNVRDKNKSTPFYVSDDSDSDDGVLKIKRHNHDIELPSNNELEMNRCNTKKKPLTKAQAVKKIIKKKIVANTKILFNEEGEALKTLNRDKKSEMAQEYENEDLGGIDIEKAKIVLREEDKFDKQLFKDKVKAKHKEEKRKAKAQKKQDEEEDEFGEEESDYEPDLSWLPDFDQIYKNKANEDESEIAFADDEVKEDR